MLFDGAVLTGGASTRMGRDKALVEVDGAPMAYRVTAALRSAGACGLFCVGGDERSLRAIGLEYVADEYAGAGPLGGILTALRAAATDVVVVVACDMPWIGAEHVTALVDALAGDGRADVARSAQHLLAAWRTRSLSALQQAFDAGERAPKRALARLETVLVELPDGPWSADVDSPDDLD